MFVKVKREGIATFPLLAPFGHDETPRHEKAGRKRLRLPLHRYSSGLALPANELRLAGVGTPPLGKYIPMKPPVPDFVPDTEPIPSRLRWMAIGIEAAVDKNGSMVEEDGTENIRPRPDQRHVQEVVQIRTLQLQAKMIPGDVLDSDCGLNFGS